MEKVICLSKDIQDLTYNKIYDVLDSAFDTTGKPYDLLIEDDNKKKRWIFVNFIGVQNFIDAKPIIRDITINEILS